MISWSDMTNDVLEHISDLLHLRDYHRFSAVCKSWRWIAKQKRRDPALEELPWLVLGEDDKREKRKFYSITEDKHHYIDIPELRNRYICGSSHGWLFAVDIKITGILINPLTRESYGLPPFPPFNEHVDVAALVEHEEQGAFSFKTMQRLIVSKAILSHDPKEHPDFTVMIMFGMLNTPALWRPGDSTWTVIEKPGYTIFDIVYFKEKWYFVTSTAQVCVVEVDPVPKLIEIKEFRCWFYSGQSYLVELRGRLLLIFRECNAEKDLFCVTDWFYVVEVDVDNATAVDRDNIDDCALFLSRNSSIVVDSSHFPGCKENAIYFAHFTTSRSYEKYGCHDLGIFDMTDESVTPFYPSQVFHPLMDAPIWFTPNP